MIEKTIKRDSLSKQVADQLEILVEAGEYKVGSKIPTEVELMEQFNVSRNTIREAIRSLTSAGILDVKQGDGTYVKTVNRFNGCMNLKYEKVSDEEIAEARESLENRLAYLAALRRTDADLESIRTALQYRQNVNDCAKENTHADILFHLSIAQAAHNTILYDLYQSMFSYIESHINNRHEQFDFDMERIDRLHEDLFYAIASQNPDQAAACATDILR